MQELKDFQVKMVKQDHKVLQENQEFKAQLGMMENLDLEDQMDLLDQ